MKEGFVVDAMGVPSEKQLEKINKLSRRKLLPDEVYTFSVVLCDNEVDRDNERFSTNALHSLAKLYIGKTGIYDHSMKSSDQVARIFDCTVEKVEGRLTSFGEQYYRLKALAYMPRSVRNKDVILEIDSGIKKEVSVGCSMSVQSCSICGADMRSGGCDHQKGRFYRDGGKKQLCVTVLDEPADAYEWSFVAVPAQPEAGVTKAFSEEKINDVIKSLECEKTVTLNAKEALSLAAYIKALKADKSESLRLKDKLKATKKELEVLTDERNKEKISSGTLLKEAKEEIRSLARLAQPETDEDILTQFIEGLSPEQLVRYKKSLNKTLDADFPPQAQLYCEKPNGKKLRDDGNTKNHTFII